MQTRVPLKTGGSLTGTAIRLFNEQDVMSQKIHLEINLI